MSLEIQIHVDQLFKSAPDRYARIRENPVTGGRFVRRLDPIGPQKRLAVSALKARAWFAEQKPEDAPELTLKQVDRERLKVGGVRYVVSLFARSLAHRDYRTEGHPNFREYAMGVMASDMTPDWVRDDAELKARYNPTPLKGLGGGLIWQGS